MRLRVKGYDCIVQRARGSFDDHFALCAYKEGDHIQCATWQWSQDDDIYTHYDLLVCPEIKTMYITNFASSLYGLFYEDVERCWFDPSCEDGKPVRACFPNIDHSFVDQPENIVNLLSRHLLELYPAYENVRLFTPWDFKAAKQSAVDNIIKEVGCLSNMADKRTIAEICRRMKPSWFDYKWQRSDYIEHLTLVTEGDFASYMYNVVGLDVLKFGSRYISDTFARCKVEVNDGRDDAQTIQGRAWYTYVVGRNGEEAGELL